MLQQARDEAHRFAVTYNRKRRSLRTVTSELLQIPGIGPSKRRLLLQTFGSIQGVKDATVEQIAALPGFSAASARRLLDVLARPAGAPPESALAVAGRPDQTAADTTTTDTALAPASDPAAAESAPTDLSELPSTPDAP